MAESDLPGRRSMHVILLMPGHFRKPNPNTQSQLRAFSGAAGTPKTVWRGLVVRSRRVTATPKVRTAPATLS